MTISISLLIQKCTYILFCLILDCVESKKVFIIANQTGKNFASALNIH